MPDRSTYRTHDDARLIEEAKYNPNRELAIALGERLQDTLAEADAKVYEAKERANDFEIDCNKLDDKVYQLQAEIAKLELMLSIRDNTINTLTAQIAKMKKGN